MKDYDSPGREVTTPKSADYHEIPRRMITEYNFPASGKAYMMLDQINGLLAHFQKSPMDLQELMTDAANLVAQQFSLKTVAIGLRGADGIYRYEVLVGYRHETEAETRKFGYTYEQFTDAAVYKGYMISKYTKVFLAEDNPWLGSEKEGFDTPSQLGTPRRSLEDYTEGDYTDIHILGKDDEILGWIEFSSTTSKRMPDMSSVRWIEFIGQIIAAAIVSQPKALRPRS